MTRRSISSFTLALESTASPAANSSCLAAEPQANWRDLLELIKAGVTKGVDLQRYKGLGEMNCNQ